MSSFEAEVRNALAAGGPGAICRLPGGNGSVHGFQWTDGSFRSDKGSAWYWQPFSTDAEKGFAATDKGTHRELVLRALRAIAGGRMDKVVVSRILRVPRKDAGPGGLVTLFGRLCEAYPAAFVYLVRHPEEGTWMGATPETLLQLRPGIVQTMALAGTRPAANPREWSEKERHEHRIVAEEIRGRLEPFGRVESDPVQTISSGPVQHLMTPIRVTTSAGASELIAALHPTSAVCGWPREEAFSFIRSEEPHARAYYTGVVGVIHADGCAEVFVNLRCMRIEDSEFVLFAGGGITAGSDPEGEWEETTLKARTLLRWL